MDWQALFDLAFTVILLLGGALGSVLWGAVRELRLDLAKLRDSMPETYMRRDDFRQHAERVESALHRIEAQLAGKADKP